MAAVGVFALATKPAPAAAVKDGFQDVSCSKPIPPALAGKHMSNERVVVTEARHKDIALKDLGADELDNDANLISWSICGKVFMLLVDSKDMVRDVLPFPTHSATEAEFSGGCSRAGKQIADAIVGVVDNSDTKAANVPAKSVWRIDMHAMRFVPEPTAGLSCDRTGIVTISGP